MTPRNPIWRSVQLLWIMLVLAVAVLFLVKNASIIGDAFERVSLAAFAVAFASIIAAKMFLTGYARIIAVNSGGALDWPHAWRAYSLSQVPKYLPGSVWQFVGRATIYRSYGLAPATIAVALPSEVAWLLISAFAFGAPAFLQSADDLMQMTASDAGLWTSVALFVGVAGLLIAAMFIFRGRWQTAASAQPKAAYLFYLSGVWVFLGVSLAALSAAFAYVDLLFLISAFALAYGVGAVAIFAPAGIGVREAAFVVIAAPSIDPMTAALIIGAHRFVYFMADIACAGVALGMAHPRRGAPSPKTLDARPSR